MIPDNINDIEPQAFKNCEKLKSVIIPNSATYLSYSSFENCISLKNVVLSNNLDSISSYCFMNCDSLTDVVIPKGIGYICDGAFADCESLKCIIIPNSVKIIMFAAFENSKKLKDIYYTGNKNEWEKIKIDKDYNDSLLKSNIHYNYTVVKSINLSKASFIYNGKNQKPNVILKDSLGRTLKHPAYYTVKYPSKMKNVGKYSVKIIFNGNYVKSKTLYFTIKPKSTTISKVTAGKKAFTVKWKKQASQTTGYQIQYSTSSKFKGAKTVTVSKNKTTSKKISKLKTKKKYYVRVRTYKTIKVNGKNTKIYSGWSKVKTVKTK